MRKKRQSGNSLIEFALSITMIALLFSAAFQFGYTFQVYNQLEGAVRAGARYASVSSYDSYSATPTSAFSAAVKNMVVYGKPVLSGGETPIVNGLTTNHVNVLPIFVNNVPYAMQVSITGYSVSALFSTYTLTNKPYATFPYLGVYAPE